MRKTMRDRQGVTLIAAVFIIVILAFAGVMFVTLIGTGSRTAVNDVQSTQALFVAGGGLENAVALLNTATLADRSTCTALDADLNAVSFGQGVFSVTTDTGSPYSSANAVTLTDAGGIDSTITTINVSADPLTQGYAPSGRILIDREAIDYSGTSGNSFVGAVRGADGTIATSHAQGTAVGQYQCSVTATGGVPDLTGSSSRRQVREGIQLPEGWAVGGGGLPADNLNGVACTSDTDCQAVGDNGTIIQWNGTNWSQVDSQTTANLHGLSCTSATDCWAVGDTGTILQWDGSNWNPATSPTTATLNGVSCEATDDCWAVGNRTSNRRNGWVFLHWNGTTWQRTQTISPTAGAQGLLAVSLFDANDGWSVGGPNQNRFVQWNGANWTEYGATAASQLNSVFLLAANNGWAVGNVSGGYELVYRWNGATWTRQAASGQIPNQNLQSVFCTGSSECFVAGANGTISRWNGAGWTNVSPGGGDQLNSLAAIDTTGDGIADDGWAVGAGGVIFRWNGTAWSQWQQANATVLRWRDVAWDDASGGLPLPPPALNGLNAISLLSYADGWAVGNADATPDEVIFHWDGSQWTRVGPSGTISNRNLTSIYCVSADECYAVGYAGGFGERPWILQYNGAWSTVNTGNTARSNLNGVFCAGTGDCWAVGNRVGGGGGGEVIMHLQAGTWGRVGPVAAVPNTNFNGVTCVATNDCWAVGNVSGGNETIIRWTGGPNWAQVGPYAGVPNTNFNGVACVATDDCWAVGDASGGNAVMIHWDGATWTQAGPYAGVPADNLNSVTCVATDDCWAAGDGGLIVHWDGATWSQVASGTVQTLQAIQVIGPADRPQAAWQEVAH